MEYVYLESAITLTIGILVVAVMFYCDARAVGRGALRWLMVGLFCYTSPILLCTAGLYWSGPYQQKILSSVPGPWIKPILLAADLPGILLGIFLVCKLHKRYLDLYGNTPLQRAVRAGWIDTVRYMLAHGGYVNCRNLQNENLLYQAIKYNHKWLADMLIDCGADPNSKSSEGWSSFHLSIIKKQWDIFLKLIASGIDVNEPTARNSTPLHLAVNMNLVPFVERLIAARAQVNIPNSKGETPLHIAVLRANPKTVYLLLKAGAVVNACDRNLLTPLHLAAQAGNLTIIGWLLKCHANPQALTRKGFAPIDLAHNEETAELLRNGVPVRKRPPAKIISYRSPATNKKNKNTPAS